MILHIFSMAVNLNAIQEIPCQQVTWISKGWGFSCCDCIQSADRCLPVADAVGTCCSSLILVLRTRAVWHQDLKITVGLGALFCGQIAVWCQSKTDSSSEAFNHSM